MGTNEAMAEPSKQPSPMENEQNVYAGVYHALLIGMVVSSALFAVGMVGGLLKHEQIVFTSDWVRRHYDWTWFVHGLMSFNPTALLMSATIILILTPVARVLISIYAFLVDRDRKYVVVTSIVFLVIVLTIVLGRSGLK
jgi:uncharacterized membrane protein